MLQNTVSPEGSQSREARIATMKTLRYVSVYPAYSDERRLAEEDQASRIRELGYDFIAFGIPVTGGWWPFPTLDQAWKQRHPPLMAAYEQIEELLRTRHVLIAGGGSMLHPEFISRLSAYTFFLCADDPESSEILSKPVAPAFDYSFMYNISCLDMYKSWGCRNAQWLFYPLVPGFHGEGLSEEKILSGERDIDIVMFSERVYGVSDRAQRIEGLARSFPQAMLRGKGWPGGYLSNEEMLDAYYRAKIGWNLHNSTGPTNQRTTMLPSYGVMEICDNKQHLGKLFKLDEEIVGFDTLQECIDKTHYYLAHDRERREIAARGWKRVMTDYTEQKSWERIIEHIADDLIEKLGPKGMLPAALSGANQPSRVSVEPGKTQGGNMDDELRQFGASLEQLFECWQRSPYPSVKIFSYFPVYDKIFRHLRGTECTFVETGILDGGSLFMWREWLGPKARIVGIDLNPDALKWREHGFEIYIGDQGDPAFWESTFQSIGKFDAFLDDGGHQSFQQMVTLQHALKYAAQNRCVIAVEDTSTSFMKDYASHGKHSFLQFAKDATDCLVGRSFDMYPDRYLDRFNVDCVEEFKDVLEIRFFNGVVVFELDPMHILPNEIMTNTEQGVEAKDYRHKGNKGADVNWPNIHSKMLVRVMGK